MPYLKLNTITITVEKPAIELDYQLNRKTRQIVNGKGSYTKFLGSGGRLISFTALAKGSRIRTIQKLVNVTSPLTLISPSQAKYNGKYKIVGFGPITEYEKGYFKIPMKLQEHYKFNITKKNFKNYQVKPKKATTKKASPSLSLNCTNIWLKNGSKGESVKKVQKLLQRKGYYLKKPVDGIFGPVTTAAVRLFQQNRRIVVDGIVGPQTCKELQK